MIIVKYIAPLLLILGFAVFARLFDFFKTFFFGDKVKRNIINPKDIDLTQFDKDLFYEKMKPYFEQNIVREIYKTDTFTIMNVGEIFYVGLPYFILENEVPFGVRLGTEVIEKCINDHTHFFSIISIAVENYSEYENYFVTFGFEQLQDWLCFIEKHKQDKNSVIDCGFEKCLQNDSMSADCKTKNIITCSKKINYSKRRNILYVATLSVLLIINFVSLNYSINGLFIKNVSEITYSTVEKGEKYFIDQFVLLEVQNCNNDNNNDNNYDYNYDFDYDYGYNFDIDKYFNYDYDLDFNLNDHLYHGNAFGCNINLDYNYDYYDYKEWREYYGCYKDNEGKYIYAVIRTSGYSEFDEKYDKYIDKEFNIGEVLLSGCFCADYRTGLCYTLKSAYEKYKDDMPGEISIWGFTYDGFETKEQYRDMRLSENINWIFFFVSGSLFCIITLPIVVVKRKKLRNK